MAMEGYHCASPSENLIFENIHPFVMCVVSGVLVLKDFGLQYGPSFNMMKSRHSNATGMPLPVVVVIVHWGLAEDSIEIELKPDGAVSANHSSAPCHFLLRVYCWMGVH